MKGWIYIISNEAMPGIVKIGYSTKDPKLRAEELNHTGSPHPYIVEYEILIEEPFQMEQKVHKILSSKRERKEWFRCSVEDAIMTIRTVAKSSIIYENILTTLRYKSGTTDLHTPDYYKCSNCGTINTVAMHIGKTQQVHCASCKRVMCLNDNFRL